MLAAQLLAPDGAAAGGKAARAGPRAAREHCLHLVFELHTCPHSCQIGRTRGRDRGTFPNRSRKRAERQTDRERAKPRQMDGGVDWPFRRSTEIMFGDFHVFPETVITGDIHGFSERQGSPVISPVISGSQVSTQLPQRSRPTRARPARPPLQSVHSLHTHTHAPRTNDERPARRAAQPTLRLLERSMMAVWM